MTKDDHKATIYAWMRTNEYRAVLSAFLNSLQKLLIFFTISAKTIRYKRTVYNIWIEVDYLLTFKESVSLTCKLINRTDHGFGCTTDPIIGRHWLFG
ncbi:hypothetical protein O206_19490 [Ochrobactrum sp. EGD-AQ16]|nr:hypothetical protein O206_19490 [Ochrobactrum sp. EGD-AQ16]